MPSMIRPTPAQSAWLKAHPGYMRTSHARAKFEQRGTLHADGTFVPATGRNPAMDGGGAFAVGIPVKRKRRR